MKLKITLHVAKGISFALKKLVMMMLFVLFASSAYATTYYIRYATTNDNNPTSSNYKWSDAQETVDGKFTWVVNGLSQGNNYFYIGTSKSTSSLLNKNIEFENNASSKVSGTYTQSYNVSGSEKKGALISCTGGNTMLILTFDFTDNGKIKIIIAGSMSITASQNPPYYLKDNITLTAKGGLGGDGDYQWYYKKASDSFYTPIAGANNATYSLVVTDSYEYKAVDTTTGIEATIKITPAVKCNIESTTILFEETFGQLDGETKRVSSSYIPSYSYKLECKPVKNGGDYAIVANPKWAGCDEITQDANSCNDCITPKDKYWFKDTYDHTQGKVINGLYGGMLLVNCQDGSGGNDLIYQRTVSGICDSTYINFSAWFMKANISNADPIGAKFVLRRGGASGTIIDTYEVNNIDVTLGWQQISAMFNSGDLNGSDVTIQLINNMPAGNNGNDLLIDDISFSICAPEAELICSNGLTSTTINSGQEEVLTSSIMNGMMDNPYYMWQKQTKEGTWVNLLDEPMQNKDTLHVKPDFSPTNYRVYIATPLKTMNAILAGGSNTSVCGMVALTNVAVVNVTFPAITITTHPKDDIVCEGKKVTFTAGATNADTYQWQKSSDNNNWVDIAGATKLEYSIENPVYTNPNVTYYRVVASTSNGSTAAVPSDAAKLTVRQLPELTSISVDKNAICAGGSTNINYTIDGGVGQYTLTMQREMNDATQAFDIANLGTKDKSGVASSFAVNPTSRATFSFTQVKDAYCTNTVDASVTVDVKSITIVTDVKDTTICSDTKATLKVKATGDDLQYQWYESTDGNNYTPVGENKNTHTTGQLIKADDKDYRYKVTVSQSSGVCLPIERGPAKVTVNDCSEFSMQYVPTKNEVCQDATIDLAFSLENTSTTMAQTGVEVTITGLANQTLTLPSSATQVGDNIIWKVGDLQPGTKQKITITLKGTKAETINSKAYVSKSGSNTYTEADQKALVPQTITVKAISRNPIVTPYASCPITGSINLVEDYVSLIDKDGNPLTDKSGVQFYELKNEVYTKTTGFVNTDSVANQTGNKVTTLYVSNTNAGECESPKVPITATVYPPVKATISGDATICNTDGAYLAINIPSGKPNFTLKYKVETDKEGPIEKELPNLADREFSIPVYPTAKTVYTLTEVEDYNKCKADLRKSGSATVVVNNKPSFTLNETTLGDLCAGKSLTLPAVTVDNGGTDITGQGWYLAGDAITSIDELSIDAHNGKSLTYKATNQCGTEEKTYTTLSVIDCADFTFTYSLSNANPCAGDTITLTATITNDGDASLSDVKLWQTWSKKQGAVNEKNPQSTFSVGSDYNNNEWVIDKFDSHTTHTLELTFIAQADEDFYMHVTESNGIPYDSWENSPAKDKAPLTVKPISGNVELNDLVDENATYKTCALDATNTQTLSLSSLVGSDKFSLQYYEEDAPGVMKQDLLTEEPIIKLNGAFGPKNYYIINTEDGKCPSKTPTKVTVQVLAKPTISLTPGEVTLKCNNQTQTVTASGALTYKWTDANGDVTTDDKLNLSRKDDSPRTYTVVGYSADNCASDALTLTVKEDFVAPDAKISMPSGNDSTLTCTLTSLELTASSTVSGVTYKWNDTNTSTSSSITVNKANVYQVTVTNPNNGCSASAVKTILSNTKDPIVSVKVLDATGKPATALTCAADKDTLSLVPSISNETEIGNKNITYTWSTNVIGVDNTTHAATVDKKDKYSVTVKGDNGCSVTEYVEIDADQTKPVLSIASSNDTLTCLLPDAKLTATVSNVEMQSYSWTKKDDAGLSNVGSDAVITVSDSAKYFVTATAVNGCVEKDSIVVPQRTDLPKVEIASTDSVQYCRVNTLTASGALTYKWSTGSDDASIEVSKAGTYTVTGTNQYGCAKDTSIVLKDRKILPTIKLTTDTTTITCKKSEVTISSEITNKIEDRTYSYVWKNEAGTIVGNGTSKAVSDDKKYTVFVTDKTSDCVGEASKKLSVNKQEPMVDVVMLPGVCLPASIDLTDAIGENTLADTVVFYANEGLTQQITETAFEVEQYHVYYAQGQQVDGNGCVGKAQPVAVNLKPATPAPTVKDYDECVKAESETFSPLVTSESYKLTFYDVAQGGTPIADAFDASDANTTTTYYVTNTNQGACESERTAFTVHIEGLVDFDLTISDDRVLVGGDDVVVTLTPAEVEVDSYKWMANDKVLEVEGEEYVTKPYVDTKFVVAAKGRCNTLSKEVDVEVVWPTAFTPYNNNGLNETFAKGFELDVYNRFGVQIFKGTDGWDGVMNQNMGANEMAMPGVYYYAVFLPDGNVKKGTIEIVKF